MDIFFIYIFLYHRKAFLYGVKRQHIVWDLGSLYIAASPKTPLTRIAVIIVSYHSHSLSSSRFSAFVQKMCMYINKFKLEWSICFYGPELQSQSERVVIVPQLEFCHKTIWNLNKDFWGEIFNHFYHFLLYMKKVS